MPELIDDETDIIEYEYKEEKYILNKNLNFMLNNINLYNNILKDISDLQPNSIVNVNQLYKNFLEERHIYKDIKYETKEETKDYEEVKEEEYNDEYNDEYNEEYKDYEEEVKEEEDEEEEEDEDYEEEVKEEEEEEEDNHMYVLSLDNIPIGCGSFEALDNNAQELIKKMAINYMDNNNIYVSNNKAGEYNLSITYKNSIWPVEKSLGNFVINKVKMFE